MTLQLLHSEFPYMRKILFYFLSVYLSELGEEEVVRAQVIERQLRVELDGLRVELVQVLQILLRIVLVLDREATLY
jgi:hypothetical protein